MTDIPEIPGSFTKIDMHAPKLEAQHPLAKAQAVMVAELSRLHAPKLHVNPEPDEFDNVADYLVRGARIIDAWIKEVGEEVRSAATTSVDMGDFTDVLKDALEGYATHQIDAVAEELREELQEVESALRHRRNAAAMVEDIYLHLGLPRR